VRIKLEDHGRFQRGALHVVVACSLAACVAALVGSDRFPPAVAVLAAAVATLALALGHVRVVLDPVANAVARASTETDGEGRGLLARAVRAREGIARSVHAEGGLPSSEGRAVVAAAAQATLALAEVSRRRYRLAERVRLASPGEMAGNIDALERRAAATSDAPAREAYARAAGALRERMIRATALEAVIERLDARLHAAVAELEGAALAAGTRAELGSAGAPAALSTACDRLHAANADLGAECEALAEVAAL